MPRTWRAYSTEIIGYEAPLTEGNAHYVAVLKVQGWLNQGRTPEQIALKWNQGHHGACGTKAGVYDSCGYARKFIRNLTASANN